MKMWAIQFSYVHDDDNMDVDDVRPQVTFSAPIIEEQISSPTFFRQLLYDQHLVLMDILITTHHYTSRWST